MAETGKAASAGNTAPSTAKATGSAAEGAPRAHASRIGDIFESGNEETVKQAWFDTYASKVSDQSLRDLTTFARSNKKEVPAIFALETPEKIAQAWQEVYGRAIPVDAARDIAAYAKSAARKSE